MDLLPDFWADISHNPILYIVNAFRYGLLGITDIDINRAFIVVTHVLWLPTCIV